MYIVIYRVIFLLLNFLHIFITSHVYYSSSKIILSQNALKLLFYDITFKDAHKLELPLSSIFLSGQYLQINNYFASSAIYYSSKSTHNKKMHASH